MACLPELDPNVEVIFSSGYFAEDRCDGTHVAGVISKPYAREEFVRMVELAPALRASSVRRGEEGRRNG